MIEFCDRPIIRHAIILVPALLLAFYLRLDNLGDWAVRFDEAFSVWLSNMEIANFTERTASDVHPPLYYWLFHLWTRLAGASEFAIRAQAMFFGLMACATVYCLTLRLSRSRLAAALALLFITLSPFHIQWSQDARMYAQTTMFAALALYAYWRNAPRLLILAGIGLALTHYYGAIILVVITLHRMIHWRDYRCGRRQFLLALSIIGAVCLLWFAYALGLIRRDPASADFPPAFAFQLMASLFTVYKSTHIDNYLPTTLFISTIFSLD